MGDFDRNLPKLRYLNPNEFEEIVNKYLYNTMANKVLLYPFEVLVVKRGGTDEEPTAEILSPIDIHFSKDGKDIPLRVAMNLGKDHMKDADKIDIIVRPFVKG